MQNTILQGKYEIGRQIGEGGQGRVYLAYDRHLRQEVAVKEMAQGAAVQKSGDLWHEAAVLKGLEHPALPRIYDFFSEDGSDYMVLEYVRGKTLVEYVAENGVLKPREAVAFLQKLAGAIAYLHSVAPPIVHGDLKPANIIVKADGGVKLVDFGTAYLLHSGAREMAGTPGFSAPELLEGGDCYESSDIYSLGAVLCFILTGEKPSAGKRGGTLPSGIKQIAARCLHYNPETRYQNVRQLQGDLENYQSLALHRRIGKVAWALFRLLAPFSLALAGASLIWREYAGAGVLDVTAFPVAAGFCLTLAGLYFLLVVLADRGNEVKIVKNVYLTEKKSVGLWTVLLFVLLLPKIAGGEMAYVAAEARAPAHLPVHIRHLDGHKLLIQHETVFVPEHDLIIEVPLEHLPKGQEMTVRVVVAGAGLEYESRTFAVLVEE